MSKGNIIKYEAERIAKAVADKAFEHLTPLLPSPVQGE